MQEVGVVLQTQHCQVSHRRAEKAKFCPLSAQSNQPFHTVQESQEPLRNAHFVNLLPSSFALGVCDKTASFNISQSDSAINKIKILQVEDEAPRCSLYPHTIHIQTAACSIHAACFKLRPLLPFHLTQFTVPYYCSISPTFLLWPGAEGTSPTQYPQCHLLACDTNPCKALLQKGLPTRLSPLWLPARMATCKIAF